MIPVFYRKEQSIHVNSFSPSPRKPGLVMEAWKDNPALEIKSFEPVTPTQLFSVHSKGMVKAVLRGAKPNGFGGYDPKVADSCRYTVGSMVAAALYAYEHQRNTISPTSGFHHAGYSDNGGFCTFNGLALASLELLKAGAKRVAIFDADYHYGDGTADILKKVSVLKTHVNHFTTGKFYKDASQTAGFLAKLPDKLRTLLEGADVLLYQAGADAHVDDPLGGWMTYDQLQKRDSIVFQVAKEMGVPVAWNFAGGYQPDIRKVIKIHTNTLQEAINAEQCN